MRVAIALAVALFCLPARAQREARDHEDWSTAEKTHAVKEEQQYRLGDEVFYGWQIFIPDSAAIALLATYSRDHSWHLPVGLLMFGASGPIVHAAHGRGLAALGSLDFRATGVFAAGYAFAKIGCHDETDEQGNESASCGEGVATFLTVLALTSVVDAVLLGREREKIRIQPNAIALAITPSAGGAKAMISGRF